MNYILSMAVTQSIHNLTENILGHIFLQLPSLSYVIEQVTPRTEFHYKDDVLVGFEGIVELDYVWVASLL